MAKQYDLLVRLLLIGDSGVGKTCMTCRFADDAFHAGYQSTIGIDFKMKSVKLDGKRVRIQVWDTAGQERYETITHQYCRRAQGIFFVYDITNEKSFKNIKKWKDIVQGFAREDVELMLLANKIDMKKERKISKQQGEKLAKELNIPFYETSAKNAANIQQAFLELTRVVLETHKKEFDNIILEREDSDGGEFISELMREKPREGNCCVLT